MKTCLIILLTSTLGFFAWYHITGGNAQHGSLGQAADEVGTRLKNFVNDFQLKRNSDSDATVPEPHPTNIDESKEQKSKATPSVGGYAATKNEAVAQSNSTEANASSSANQTQNSPREEAIDILSGIVRLIDESH